MLTGHKNELDQLTILYRREARACVVLHGRRNVGKSTLLHAFCKNKKAVYFTAAETIYKNNLANLTGRVLTIFPAKADEAPAINDASALFAYLADRARHEKCVLVIDDYPRLAANESFDLSLRAFMEQAFKETQLFLILCGATNLLQKQVLQENITASIKLEPLDYWDSAAFLPGFGAADKAMLYGVTGGYPGLLARIDPTQSAKDNIARIYFEQPSPMDEPVYALKQDLREPAIYNALLEAVAYGAENMDEITAALSFEANVCAAHLKPLMALAYIDKEKCLFDTRKTAYRIRDLSFLFWYRYVSRYRSDISTGDGRDVFDTEVWPDIPRYMATVFPRMAAQYLVRKNNRDELPFHFTKLGRWWNADVVCEPAAADPDTKKILLAQCRYANEHAGMEAVTRMRESVTQLRGANDLYFALFSRCGFTRQVLNQCGDMLLVDIKDMYQ